MPTYLLSYVTTKIEAKKIKNKNKKNPTLGEKPYVFYD